MLLPKKPYKGTEVLGWAKSISDYVKEISPRSGSGVKVNRTPNGTTFSSPHFYSDDYPFEVIRDATYTPTTTEHRVSIRGGLFDITYKGATVSLPISNGGDFSYDSGTDLATTTTTIAADETKYVYLEITGTAGRGDIAKPSALSAYISTTRPNETTLNYQPGSIKVLAKIKNQSGVLTITQEWTGGHITLQADVIDSIDEINTDHYNSIGLSADNLKEIYGFSLSTTAFGKVPYSDSTTKPRSIGWQYPCMANGNSVDTINDICVSASLNDLTLTFLKYDYDVGLSIPGFSNLSYLNNNDIDFSSAVNSEASSAATTIINNMISSGDLVSDHGQLTFSGDDHTGTASDRYLEASGDGARNNVSGVFGTGAGVISIDPTNHKLYSGVGAYTVDWLNRLLDGADWSVNSGTIFKVLDTSTSQSTVADNSIYTNGGLGVSIGLYAKKGTAGSAGKFDDGTYSSKLSTGSESAEFTDGTRKLTACDGTYSVDAEGSINTDTSYMKGGTKVVGEQGSAVSDVSITAGTITETGSDEDGVARAEINKLVADVGSLKDQLNLLLARVRTHGLIAT